MKKILVLFLVLGMASMANAALSLEYQGSSGPTDIGILTWDISGMEIIGTADTMPTESTFPPAGDYSGSIGLLGAHANNTDLTPGRPGDGMPIREEIFGDPPETYDVRNIGLGGITWDPTYLSYGFTASDGPAPQLRALGEWYVFDVNLALGTEFTAEFWGDDNGWAESLGTMDLKVVPEPMTLTLLGLGGLGLLRRRR